jgi:hypothetical protein
MKYWRREYDLRKKRQKLEQEERKRQARLLFKQALAELDGERDDRPEPD